VAKESKVLHVVDTRLSELHVLIEKIIGAQETDGWELVSTQVFPTVWDRNIIEVLHFQRVKK